MHDLKLILRKNLQSNRTKLLYNEKDVKKSEIKEKNLINDYTFCGIQ